MESQELHALITELRNEAMQIPPYGYNRLDRRRTLLLTSVLDELVRRIQRLEYLEATRSREH